MLSRAIQSLSISDTSCQHTMVPDSVLTVTLARHLLIPQSYRGSARAVEGLKRRESCRKWTVRGAHLMPEKPDSVVSPKRLHHMAQFLSFGAKVRLIQRSWFAHMLLTEDIDSATIQPQHFSRIVRQKSTRCHAEMI